MCEKRYSELLEIMNTVTEDMLETIQYAVRCRNMLISLASGNQVDYLEINRLIHDVPKVRQVNLPKWEG